MKEILSRILEANKIGFLTGAGISTASGIPDFRSKGGFYEENVETYLSDYFYRSKPKLFWPKYKEIFNMKLMGNYEPNSIHYFITHLEKNLGKKTVVVTQNVDGLHHKAGSKKVYEIHGSIDDNYCPKCGKMFDINYINEHEIPRCDKVNAKGNKCDFILKPGVVLFGQSIINFDEAVDELLDCDLFFTMGTSLKVYRANTIPQIMVSEGVYSIMVNEEKTEKDIFFNEVYNDSLVDWVNRIIKELK